MGWLESALTETADQPGPETLATLQASLDPVWIEEALSATGTATLRRRRLPAEQVIWLVLGMAILRDRPIREVVSKLDLALAGCGGDSTVAPSSIAEARQRVGPEPLQWLFERCSKQWALESAERWRWRGLSLLATDGTTLRVSDSEDNRKHFGLAKGGERGDSGYPLVRLAAVIAVRSHLIAAAAFGPYSSSEHELADQCLPAIPDHSLTILDKNYLAAKYLVGIERGGDNRHWLLRAKSNTKWRVMADNGPGDWLVELAVSRAARAQDPTLPTTIRARAVAYQHPDSKGPQVLLTSLLDANVYPAEELVERYHERWEIELAYDELKTHMLEREETIRSRTVNGVQQELWGILLAYNLVRLEMERIAQEATVEPTRISFMMATRYIRDEWLWCSVASPGSIPTKLRKMRQKVSAFVLPPRRRQRRFPRAVKLKMSNYARKRRPDTTATKSKRAN